MRKFLFFWRLSQRRKFLLGYTGVVAVYSWFLFSFFKKQADFSTKKRQFVPDAKKVSDSQMALANDIRWAILVVSKYFFLENVCRHQALQAKILCTRYKIPYTIFIGFKRNEAGKTEGHAWTEVGILQISGRCKAEEYTVLQQYTNKKI